MTVRIENGKLTADTAAELDAYLVGEQAYKDAIAAGATDADALDVGRAALAEHKRTQFLRSLGITDAA